QRLQLIAAAGGKAEMTAFLGKGFGGRRPNALGGDGDENAFAAQMQIHGNARLFLLKGQGFKRARLLGGRYPGGQHCTAALSIGALISPPVWSIAGPSNKALERAGWITRKFSMNSAKKTYRIAVIPGDGIGKEVMPEGLRVIEAAAKKHGVSVQFDHFDFAPYDYYAKHGQMMPDDWKDKIGKHDAIYFGAVGWPAKIPDHVSLWGSLIKFRREFDQYVNLRPVRLMPGVPSPL